ncbi:hypothetical protein T459_31238 [Capsicum annuum]|uniref:Uncharacterized protein n=1 Tax=Capsicum annuum TaxID=4072 RepID=A0A2G2YAN1_CAPAN|nr:hypothetical protein T459_31238 [Capsicum annuum]
MCSPSGKLDGKGVIDSLGSWKARLHVIYSSYNNDKDRLSHRLEDVELDDWKHLVEHFGRDKFKGNPLIGEKEIPDKIWEIQHTRKNVNGERVWLDP